MFKTDIKIDLKGVNKKVSALTEKMQFELDSQVLKDANYFLPKDTGNLEDSSILASELGKGKLVWDAPYARKLYWNPQYNFSKDKNPNARGKWFEEAKSLYINDWIKLINNL